MATRPLYRCAPGAAVSWDAAAAIQRLAAAGDSPDVTDLVAALESIALSTDHLDATVTAAAIDIGARVLVRYSDSAAIQQCGHEALRILLRSAPSADLEAHVAAAAVRIQACQRGRHGPRSLHAP